MVLLVHPDGTILALYSEAIDLKLLGRVSIRRASFVEPDGEARWWVDLRPAGGPKLGPFDLRTKALAAEQDWLGTHWLPVRSDTSRS
jgi:hypothetical protein